MDLRADAVERGGAVLCRLARALLPDLGRHAEYVAARQRLRFFEFRQMARSGRERHPAAGHQVSFSAARACDTGSPLDISQWAALLRSASALEAYRSAYGNSIGVERVVEFMLFDAAFPRAARFCVERLEMALNRIASVCPAELRASAENKAARVPSAFHLGSKLRAGNASTAIAGGLHEYLLAIQADCAAIGDEIFTSYFKCE